MTAQQPPPGDPGQTSLASTEAVAATSQPVDPAKTSLQTSTSAIAPTTETASTPSTPLTSPIPSTSLTPSTSPTSLTSPTPPTSSLPFTSTTPSISSTPSILSTPSTSPTIPLSSTSISSTSISSTSISSTSSTSSTTTPSATSTSKHSSGKKTGAIAGGVIGGIAFLSLIGLLAFWLLRRRKRRNFGEKRGLAEPVSYSGLNSSFAGVQFAHAQNRDSGAQSALYTQTNSSAGQVRDWAGSPEGGRDSAIETDRFLPPSYRESQAEMSSGQTPLTRLDSGNANHPNIASAAPSMGLRDSRQDPDVWPLSPQSAMQDPRESRDTMGFPFPGEPYSHEPGHEDSAVPTMVSPTPQYHTIDQNPPEMAAGQGNGSYQDRGVLGRSESQQTRSISPVSDYQNAGRASPVSLLDTQPVGVNRNVSQRTVSSIGSNYPGMVSDADLDRLGVGSPRRVSEE